MATSLPDAPYLLGATPSGSHRARVEISVVLPCLNEEDSVAATVSEALEGIRSTGLIGEVIVVDNGSTDRSEICAIEAGARVVRESRRGYGNACRRGLFEARGRLVFMGDADGTYDFRDIPRFLAEMTPDMSIVMGSRLNNRMERGAMPWSHRHLGNPFITATINRLFGVGVADAYCGMRVIRRAELQRMNLAGTGMEFALEYLTEAARLEMLISQIPISYRRRFGGQPKLRTFADGWRSIAFMLGRRYGLARFTPSLDSVQLAQDQSPA